MLVAGTNGKGSVCAMVDAACRAAGVRTALLTKPHLLSYRERVVLSGRPVDHDTFATLVSDVLVAAAEVEAAGGGAPTQFELLTAVGLLGAHRHGAEVLVCEVGLGGRLDSTNVLDPGVAVVTGIALDHREYLGDTIEEIAAEKAGILKPDNDVVTGAEGTALAVIRARAATVGVRSLVLPGDGLSISGSTEGLAAVRVTATAGDIELTDVRVPLGGGFQVDNAGTAVAVCDALRRRGTAPLTSENVRAGLEQVRWRARLQVIEGRPPLVIDGAHNAAAVEAIVPAVRDAARGRRLVALVGCMADKDVDRLLAALVPLDAFMVFTEASSDRAARAVDLARAWPGPARAVSALPEALAAARTLAGDDGAVLVCGSLYLAGDVLRLVGDTTPR